MIVPRAVVKLLRPALVVALFSSLGLTLDAPRPALAQQQQQTPPPSPDVERGRRLYEKNDVKGAAKLFRKAVKERDDDYVAWFYLGQALMLQRDYEEALRAQEKAVKLAPGFAAAHAARAYILASTGKTAEAEEAARRALELDERQVDAHYAIGLLRLRECRWSEAIEKAELVIRQNERAANAYLMKSNALMGLYSEELKKLSAQNKKEGEEEPGERSTENTRAAQLQRLRGAIESLEKYVALNPKAADFKDARLRLDALRFDLRAATDEQHKIYKSSEVVRKAVILKKPKFLHSIGQREQRVRRRSSSRGALVRRHGDEDYGAQRPALRPD